jgi:hypothetical protein
VKHNRWRPSSKVMKPWIIALPLVLGAGAVGTGLAVHATGSTPGRTAVATSLPPAKQGVIDHMNQFRGPTNAPHAAAPGPSSAVAQSIMAQPSQGCTRDASLLPSGLLSDAPARQDFPSQSYTFNNEWMDPLGAYALLAGNVGGDSQGAIGTETWSPPTSCNMSESEYLAPSNSGSLTLTGVSGSTVSLSSSAGTNWTFSLTTDTFAEAP